MALVSNAMVVQRLTAAKRGGATPKKLTQVLLELPRPSRARNGQVSC
ncbi:hypothetical protein ACFQ3Z_01990 [Streptomyces nogalater]